MYDLWWISGIIFMMAIISVFDIKTRTIPLWGIVCVFVITIAYIWKIENIQLIDILFSIVPGFFFIFLSFVTRERIGYGDGVIILAIGLVMGLEQCVFVISIAILLSSLFASILLVRRVATKNTQVAFIPFLTVAMGVVTYAGL